MNTVKFEESINSINYQLKVLEKGISWVESNLKAERKSYAYSELVNIRRELNKIKYALQQNPAAAFYGESQVGKSYLANILLSNSKGEFLVQDELKNKEYKFLDDINPAGGGGESTSVITRFSTKIDIVNKKFPIMIKVMSVKDVALVLIDSVLSEFKDDVKVLSLESINESLINFKESITNPRKQSNFSEDDVLDIKDYITDFFPASSTALRLSDSNFWELAPKLIENSTPNEWFKILEIIWGENEFISKQFNQLVSVLNILGYEEIIYTNYEAVLRENKTLLDVERLKELNNSELESTVFLPNINETKVLNKSILCALTGEICFKLDKSIEDSKPFLKNIDLLDFPGSRYRMPIKEESVKESIPSMILRGKVSYIFNKYSNNYLINNLLFCNKSEQPTVGEIPEILNSWITRFIGENPEEREEYLKHTSVSPLFIIYTWYNTDLAFSSTNDKSIEDLKDKWKKRFITFFENEIVGKNYNWHKEWSISNEFFQNNYMLRDIKLSEEDSQLFIGFRDNGREETKNENAYSRSYPNYWEDLKTSFVDYPFVKNHFEDPELMWKESSTLNNDGSLPIIRNLTTTSNDEARNEKLKRQITKQSNNLNEELKKHYHNDDNDQNIRIAFEKSSKIISDLDIAIGKDPYFFGNFIHQFMIKEGDIFKYYHDKIAIGWLAEGRNFPEYAAIRMRLNGLSTKKEDYDQNIELLMNTYSFSSEIEMEEYYKEKGIDLNELFYGEAKRIKSSSQMLAEGLVAKWQEDKLKEENFQEFIDSNLISNNSVSDLIENIKMQFNNLGITDIIAKKIRVYVDRFDRLDTIQEMISDTSAAVINKFINTMGVAYFSDNKLEEIEEINNSNKLGLVTNHDHLEFKTLKEEDLDSLIETIGDIDKIFEKVPLDINKVKNIPSFSHFLKWIDLMKISFISTCDIRSYNLQENNKLCVIINELTEAKN